MTIPIDRTHPKAIGATAGPVLSKFSHVFSRSQLGVTQLGVNAYFVKGSRFSFLSTYYEGKYPTNWKRLLQTLRRLELPYAEEVESGSPVNATSIHRTMSFLDGGFISREGNYFCGLKGAWVVGRKALRYVCYEIGVEQPRRLPGESVVPEYHQLLAEVFWQIEEDDPTLKLQMNELRSFE